MGKLEGSIAFRGGPRLPARIVEPVASPAEGSDVARLQVVDQWEADRGRRYPGRDQSCDRKGLGGGAPGGSSPAGTSSGRSENCVRRLVRDTAPSAGCAAGQAGRGARSKQSGIGVEMGREGLEEFTQATVINVAK
jgi:hypothetical protein